MENHEEGLAFSAGPRRLHTEPCSPNKAPNRPPIPSCRPLLALQELYWGTRKKKGTLVPKLLLLPAYPEAQGGSRGTLKGCWGSFSCVRVAPMSSFYLSRILSSSQGNMLSLISEQVRREGERKRKHGPVGGELDSVSAVPDPPRLNQARDCHGRA